MANLLMLGLVLLACRNAPASSPTAAATQDADAAEATPTADVPAPGNYELSIAEHDVVLHLPPSYDGSRQLPLILVLHGGAGSGEQIQRLSEMDADADEFGFVVAYPDGSGRLEERLFTWNAGHCCGYAYEKNIDDVGFLELLIDSLVSEYAIDPARVYIAGISNGGMMAYRAGAELADKVAGIAPTAASLGGQADADSPLVVPGQPSSAVAVIAFNGMQDQHVLYEGGIAPEAILTGRVDLSVAESIQFWLDANSCDTTPTEEILADGNVLIETYGNCAENADVVLVTIVDGGHAWPGASRGLVSDIPTQDISANEMMLEFFLAHPQASD